MTTDVLSSMDSDEVNSINDTVEASQVARVIRACYFDIISNDLPDTTTLLQLDSSTDITQPVIMYCQEPIHSIVFLKYNKRLSTDDTDDFNMVKPLSVEDFFMMTHTFSLDDDNISSMTANIGNGTFEFLYRTDKSPDYYTCFDNETFIFDSIDTTVDTVLQKSKTFTLGELETTFSLVDDYVIDLNEKEHIWLLNEAKALAFQELKQQTHQKAEQTAKRQRIKAQHRKYVNNDINVYYNSLPIYGRRMRSNTTPAIIMH